MSIPIVKLEQLTGTDAHRYCTELSDLGMRAYPTSFEIPGLGNGQAFLAEHVERDSDGTIQFVRYGQLHGCIAVTIFND